MAATLMESELIHQRDVAKEMAHELRRQLIAQEKREHLIEQRALKAELRRHEFESSLKRSRLQLQHVETNFRHHVVSILLGGLLGGLLGWLCGIVLLLFDVPAFVAFFLMGPCVGFGALGGIGLGLAHRQSQVLRLQRRVTTRNVSFKQVPPPAISCPSVWHTALVCAKDVSLALVEYLWS
ncbi:Aste57867_22934 [Aphanomyces stellatus]|uniref:Aste57867_22934 protein n=1 Tax=Aphanomyces stellatus TaxID=120398 RepID=A0A485LME6_9STRA|nr:hypothetical protein As57867_022863 [Aphanomyces stellatus]VFT99584.1 Aste57867_22934 [Aphanomyces stellatus]